MKRLFLPLIAFTVAGASSSGVVSCISASYTPGFIGERLMLITDSGRIHDQSFNQSSYEAITEYSDRKPEENAEGKYGGFDFKNRGLSPNRNYIEPLTSDSFSFVSAYKMAAIKGTDILVLSGFQHAGTVDKASKILGDDKTIIFADSEAGNSDNIINLVYNSQLAGFAAAWDSAVWATTPDPNNPDRLQGAAFGNNYVSFAVFGGISNKFSVDNFLWGFMVAIRYWNMRIAEDSSQPKNRHIYFANAGKRGEIENARQISGTNPNYYSNSFEPGGSVKSGTVANLISNEADVIFPVAGPQTLDALNYSKIPYVIGVDTDQTLQYTDHADRFITSAVKNLKKSIADAVDHSKTSYNNHNEDGSLKAKPVVGGEYWDGTIAPAQMDWSTDLDQTTNPGAAKFKKSLLNYSDEKWAPFVNEMQDFYANEAGANISQYMSPDTITKIAQRIHDKYGELLPLNFED